MNLRIALNLPVCQQTASKTDKSGLDFKAGGRDLWSKLIIGQVLK